MGKGKWGRVPKPNPERQSGYSRSRLQTVKPRKRLSCNYLGSAERVPVRRLIRRIMRIDGVGRGQNCGQTAAKLRPDRHLPCPLLPIPKTAQNHPKPPPDLHPPQKQSHRPGSVSEAVAPNGPYEFGVSGRV